MAALFILCSSPAHAALNHHTKTQPPKPETDFDCAVHAAYGEARNTSRQEEAVVINLLLNRARRAHLSVCQAAHKFFVPRKGSTPGIAAAARNVMQGDKSLVPQKFIHATEMRAPGAPPPPERTFRCLGSVDKTPANGMRGNIFYEPRAYKSYQQ